MDSLDGKMTRRQFMTTAIAAIGSLIGGAGGLPAVSYVGGPALKKTADEWVRLGAISKVELGTPTLFKTVIERQTGWITDQQEISAYVLTGEGQNYVGM